jgi:hypothetical protein
VSIPQQETALTRDQRVELMYLLQQRDFIDSLSAKSKKHTLAMFSRVSMRDLRVLLSEMLQDRPDGEFFTDEIFENPSGFEHQNSIHVEEIGERRRINPKTIHDIREMMIQILRRRSGSIIEEYGGRTGELKDPEANKFHILTDEEYAKNKEYWDSHLRIVGDKQYADHRESVLYRRYVLPLKSMRYINFLFAIGEAPGTKFLYNPLLYRNDNFGEIGKDTDSGIELLKINQDTVQNVECRVLNMVGDPQRFFVSGQQICEKCGQTSQFKVHELFGQSGKKKIRCQQFVGDRLCTGKTELDEKLETFESKRLYIYQVEFKTSDSAKLETICFSFCRLQEGFCHKVCVLSTDEKIYILARKPEADDDENYLGEFIEDDDYEKYMERRHGILKHNLLLIDSKLRRLVKNKIDVEIEDTGTLTILQYIIMCMERLYYFGVRPGQYTRIHALTYGHTSVGKSFLPQIFGRILFPRFHYSEQNLRTSLARMTGGMDDVASLSVDGVRKVKIFVPGLLSRFDLLVFNEGGDLLAAFGKNSQNSFADVLKGSLDSGEVTNDVMGGRVQTRIASVIIVGNYKQSLIELYRNKIHAQLNRANSMRTSYGGDSYLQTAEMHLLRQLKKEDNTVLRDAIAIVRRQAEIEGLDFLSGLEVAMLRRFVFFNRIEGSVVQRMKDIDMKSEEAADDSEEDDEYSVRDLDIRINPNSLIAELKHLFPFVKLSKKQKMLLKIYINSQKQHPAMRARNFDDEVLMRILRILMSLNREKTLSDATKQLFERLVVEPAWEFISEAQYNLLPEIEEEDEHKEEKSLLQFEEKDIQGDK